MDVECRADRETCVARRGLNVHFFKRCLSEDFSIGYAIEGHTAGKAQRFLARPFVKIAQHTK